MKDGTALNALARLLERPLQVADVGARNGALSAWAAFDPYVKVVGFEPDEDECKRLELDYKGPADRTFIPVALGANAGGATLHVTRDPECSSLYEPDPAVSAGFDGLEVHNEVGRREVQLETLDSWAEAAGVDYLDYLKLDVQGAELDVLRGGERMLGTVRAVSAEVEFNPMYRDQPLFGDVDSYLREHGFVLWRLRDLWHTRLATVPGTPDEGRPFPGMVEAEISPYGGKLHWADAYYVRGDFASPAPSRGFQELVRDACVATPLDFPELSQQALRIAIDGAPRPARGIVSAALTVSQRGGSNNGRSFERAHIARLQDELGRLYEVESRTLGWRLQRVRRRVDYWTSPRLGILKQHPPQPLTVTRDEAAAVAPHPAPGIALVTPSLNQAQFIERTLRSVAAQEYPELEHVVRDGGSTDGTLDILGKYNGALTWHSEPDAGQAAALNAGFAATHGEIMGWLNADDLLLPGALAAVARHFAAHPDIDLIYGHRALIDEEDRQIGAWVMPPHERDAFLWADWIPQETMFFRRSLWERAGGTLNENFHFALDWDLLLRFDAAGARMERLPHTLGAFRVHGAQKTQGLGTLYEEERALLMTRTHGRPVSQQETMDRSRSYLRRHVLHHTLYRARVRLDGAGRVPAGL